MPKAPLRGALVLGGRDDADVVAQLGRVAADAASGSAPAPAAPDPALADAAVRVAIDYADAADLARRRARPSGVRGGSPGHVEDAAGPGRLRRARPGPKVAFLYTGQGSQYVNMLQDLRAQDPVVAETFAEADRIMTPLLGRPLSSYIFVDGDDPAAVSELEQQLMQTEITQPAVLATDLALTRLLEAYGVRPDMVMGHSLGEYGALVAAGAHDLRRRPGGSERPRARDGLLSVDDNGAMAAVFGPLTEIERVVDRSTATSSSRTSTAPTRR